MDNPNEKFFILAGGRGTRMGRGVTQIETTKGLIEIPPHGTILGKLINQLFKYAFCAKFPDIVLCLGYTSEKVLAKFNGFGISHIITWTPEKEERLIYAILQAISTFPDLDRYVFLLADTVWSTRALSDFLSKRNQAPVVFYHDKGRHYTETFAIAIERPLGTEALISFSTATNIFKIKGERTLDGRDIVAPDQCRLGHFEQWINRNLRQNIFRLGFRKLRFYQEGAVDDIDNDEQLELILPRIARGEFD